jgi:mono/diheme cytochrome c family protein
MIGSAVCLFATHAKAQSAASTETRIAPLAPAPAIALQQSSVDSFLVWDRQMKEVTVPNGTVDHLFHFNVTNISTETVSITGLQASCGCTTPHPPALPWILEPGATGQLPVKMNVEGKHGTIIKSVTVHSDKGSKVLIVKMTVPAPTAAQMASSDRAVNQKLALTDRQAVLRGDCAVCHVTPAHNLNGEPLYVKMCGVCHEAEHRASMVPDLHALKHETNAEYWRNWITHGRPGTLMPAFALSEGGVLTRDQVESLVKYLTVAIPGKPGTAPAVKPATAGH